MSVKILYSNLPYHEWIKIIIIHPLEDKMKYVNTPMVQGKFISYQCMFSEWADDKHVFEIVFPYYVWNNAFMLARKPKDVKSAELVEMEILKEHYELLRIRNMKVLK